MTPSCVHRSHAGFLTKPPGFEIINAELEELAVGPLWLLRPRSRKFGAARGLAGDERLAGELDLLVVARRRDDIASRRDEAAT